MQCRPRVITVDYLKLPLSYRQVLRTNEKRVTLAAGGESEAAGDASWWSGRLAGHDAGPVDRTTGDSNGPAHVGTGQFGPDIDRSGRRLAEERTRRPGAGDNA